jgi:hypothetical protein
MKNEEVEYDFVLRVDFEKGSQDPSRVFSTMTSLIQTFQSIDSDLAKTIDSSISPVLLLEDVDSGSLKTYLRNILTSIDDNAIKDFDWKKLVGAYLYKAKYKILEFIDENPTIDERKQIESLQKDLLFLAEETNVRGLPGYAPIPTDRLLNGIKKLSSSTSNLAEEDTVEYITKDGTIRFNKDFKYDAEKIESLLTREILSSTNEMVLKVKKPDYLGESMWDFKHGDHPIQAKIIHTEWLANFQSRSLDLRPGDSIRAMVEVQVSYGYKNEIIATHHYVKEVLDIMPGQTENENDLFN